MGLQGYFSSMKCKLPLLPDRLTLMNERKGLFINRAEEIGVRVFVFLLIKFARKVVRTAIVVCDARPRPIVPIPHGNDALISHRACHYAQQTMCGSFRAG